jgi:hypothetical protein
MPSPNLRLEREMKLALEAAINLRNLLDRIWDTGQQATIIDTEKLALLERMVEQCTMHEAFSTNFVKGIRK